MATSAHGMSAVSTETGADTSKIASEFRAIFGESGRNSFVFTNGYGPYYTECMGMLQDGCIEVNLVFAKICILAEKKGHGDGVRYMLSHERAHRKRGTPITFQESMYDYADDFSKDHVKEEHDGGKKLELVGGNNNVVLSELYALKESSNPIGDFSSMMAIIAASMYSDNERDGNPIRRKLWDLHGRRANVRGTVDYYLQNQAARSDEEYIYEGRIRKIRHYNYFSKEALKEILRETERKYADLIRA
jgi:hypothetical protein